MSISSIRDCMTLISKGECFFKKLTPLEVVEYARELKSGGLKEKKTRRVRSDLGKKHARRSKKKIVEVPSSQESSDGQSDDDESSSAESGNDDGDGDESDGNKRKRGDKKRSKRLDDSEDEGSSRKKSKSQESDRGKRHGHRKSRTTKKGSYTPKRVEVIHL
jgi:hypothetical protein